MRRFRALVLVRFAGLIFTAPALASDVTGPSRLISVSARSRVDARAQQVITLTADTDSPRHVLVRSIGRGLPVSRRANTLPTPVLTLLHDAQVLAHDRGSAIAPHIAELARIAGTFPVAPAGSPAFSNYGSALAPRLGRGDYTLITDSGDRGSGHVWFELHELDAAASRPLVRKVSLRGQTGPGDDVMILGLNVSGESPLRLLVRGVVGHSSTTATPTPPADVNIEFSGGSSAPAPRETGSRRSITTTRTKLMRAFTVQPGTYTALVRAGGDSILPATLEVHVLD